jgi:hypothetical protein
MEHRYISSRHRLCLHLLLGAFVVLLSLVAAFSYLIDPLSLYRNSKYIHPLPANSARMEMSSYSYITKAKRIAVEKPARILLGTSIVDDAFRLRGSLSNWFDPKPELRTRLLEKSGSAAGGYYNAAIKGGGAQQMLDYLQFAYRNNPKLDSVILGVEYGMFYPLASLPRIPRTSLLDEQGVPFSFSMEYLLSPLVLQGAYKVFYAELQPRLREHFPSPELLEIPPALEWEGAVHLRTGPEKENDGVFAPSATSALAPEKQREFNRFIVTVWYANLLTKGVIAGSGAQKHKQAKEDFEKIVDFCRTHSIDLQVYRSPQPPVFWAVLERFGLQTNEAEWYREMTAEVPIWDFAQSIDYSPTGDSLFILDPIHFAPEGGEIILPTILKRQQDVDRVSAPQVEAAIAARRAMLERWKTTHREIEDAIVALPAESMVDNPKMFTLYHAALVPILLEPEYKGYRVIKVLGYYIAIPAAIKAPYDGYRLIARKYVGALTANTAGAMAAAIDDAVAQKTTSIRQAN